MVGFNQQWLNTDIRGKTNSKIRKLGSRALFLTESRVSCGLECESVSSSVKVGRNRRKPFGGGVFGRDRRKDPTHLLGWICCVITNNSGVTYVGTINVTTRHLMSYILAQ